MFKTAIIFPGQGSQFPLMGSDFYEQSEIYKTNLDKLFSINPKLKTIWEDKDGTDINLTENAQPLLYAGQVSMLAEIKNRFNVQEEVYAGFSLGEYSALSSAGLYDYDLGLEIVQKRASLMGSVASDYKTKVVIGKTKEQLEKIINIANEDLNTNIIISNYNLEKQLLINFPQKDEESIINTLTAKGVRRLVDIKVSGPFHTKIYEDVSCEFFDFLQSIKLEHLNKPIYLNYTANKYDKSSDIKNIMKEQMINGVLWYSLVQNMIADGVNTFVEIGSKSVLSAMVKKIDKTVNVITIQNIEDIDELTAVWDKK